jgi:hypothetical protein
MMIQEETPIYLAGETQYSILRYAAMAAKWKDPPRDALDTLVLGAADLPSLDNVKQVRGRGLRLGGVVGVVRLSAAGVSVVCRWTSCRSTPR